MGLRNQPCQPRGEPYDEEGGEGSHHPARPRHHGSEGACKAPKDGVRGRSACVPEKSVTGPASAGDGEPPAHPDAENGESRTISLGDRVREDSRAVVEAIRATGREVVLVTGDVEESAQRMAGEAGITKTLAGFTPSAKAEWITARRDEGRKVLFAGDGLNDGPGLAQADVGVAMGTGAAASILVADGVISVPSLEPLLAGFRAAKAARHSIRQNQIRSIGYNIAAVTAAAAGLVNPLVAAVLMPLSSGMVIWGASRVEQAVRRGE